MSLRTNLKQLVNEMNLFVMGTEACKVYFKYYILSSYVFLLKIFVKVLSDIVPNDCPKLSVLS